MNDNAESTQKKVMDRLKQARVDQLLSQDDLAKKCGWGDDQGGRVSNYERISRTADLSVIHEMATALGLTMRQVLFGDDDPASKWVELPILSMEDLPIHSYDEYLKLKGKDMYMLTTHDQRRLVSLQVEGDAMESSSRNARSIRDGDTIVFEEITDTEKKPKHGDIVIGFINGSVKIREYFKDGADAILRAFNNDYSSFPVDQKTNIFGIVTTVTWKAD